MRDHRAGMDPSPQTIPWEEFNRRATARGHAVRVTRPDWTIGSPRKKKTTTKKARRKQAAESRRKNR